MQNLYFKINKLKKWVIKHLVIFLTLTLSRLKYVKATCLALRYHADDKVREVQHSSLDIRFVTTAIWLIAK